MGILLLGLVSPFDTRLHLLVVRLDIIRLLILLWRRFAQDLRLCSFTAAAALRAALDALVVRFLAAAAAAALASCRWCSRSWMFLVVARAFKILFFIVFAGPVIAAGEEAWECGEGLADAERCCCSGACCRNGETGGAEEKHHCCLLLLLRRFAVRVRRFLGWTGWLKWSLMLSTSCVMELLMGVMKCP